MPSERIETVRRFLKAIEQHDSKAIRLCLGPGYTSNDKAVGKTSRTREELAREGEEFRAWSDLQYEVEAIFETTDGAVVAQLVKSGTLTGPFRSLTGSGQHVRYSFCDIFRFDDAGRIVQEDWYYDLLSIKAQL